VTSQVGRVHPECTTAIWAHQSVQCTGRAGRVMVVVMHLVVGPNYITWQFWMGISEESREGLHRVHPPVAYPHRKKTTPEWINHVILVYSHLLLWESSRYKRVKQRSRGGAEGLRRPPGLQKCPSVSRHRGHVEWRGAKNALAQSGKSRKSRTTSSLTFPRNTSISDPHLVMLDSVQSKVNELLKRYVRPCWIGFSPAPSCTKTGTCDEKYAGALYFKLVSHTIIKKKKQPCVCENN